MYGYCPSIVITEGHYGRSIQFNRDIGKKFSCVAFSEQRKVLLCLGLQCSSPKLSGTSVCGRVPAAYLLPSLLITSSLKWAPKQNGSSVIFKTAKIHSLTWQSEITWLHFVSAEFSPLSSEIVQSVLKQSKWSEWEWPWYCLLPNYDPFLHSSQVILPSLYLPYIFCPSAFTQLHCILFSVAKWNNSYFIHNHHLNICQGLLDSTFPFLMETCPLLNSYNYLFWLSVLYTFLLIQTAYWFFSVSTVY